MIFQLSLYEPWREIDLVGIRSTPTLKKIDLLRPTQIKGCISVSEADIAKTLNSRESLELPNYSTET